MPNQCKNYCLLFSLVGNTCIGKAAKAVCHTYCSSHTLRSYSSCVQNKTSFITSFISFHSPGKQLGVLFKELTQLTHPPFHVVFNPFEQSFRFTWFHFTSLRHSFISVLFSPPAVTTWQALHTSICVLSFIGTNPHSCKHAT